jgi:hypothetical protein
MRPIIVTAAAPAANFFTWDDRGETAGPKRVSAGNLERCRRRRQPTQGGPDPGVGGSGVWFQALELSQAVCTSRWTALPFQLPAETETQPP